MSATSCGVVTITAPVSGTPGGPSPASGDAEETEDLSQDLAGADPASLLGTIEEAIKVHHEVKVRAGKGYRIVYVGHEGHEEAVGTMAVAPEAIHRVESVTEVGRQPWAVEGVLPTALGASSLSVPQLWTTIVLFTLLYGALAVVEVGLILRHIKKGPFAEQEAFASAAGEPAVA